MLRRTLFLFVFLFGVLGTAEGTGYDDKKLAKDQPPTVEFKPESFRNPDPDAFDGQGDPADYEFDMPLAPEGVILIVYTAKSELGIRAANIRYRVMAKGVVATDYPEEFRRIQHPKDDPKVLVFTRLPLRPFDGDPAKLKLGKFVPELGIFEQSYRDVKRFDRSRVNVEFYAPPGKNEAGGRVNLEVVALTKTVPDGKGGLKSTKLGIGDTVEVYVEAFDDSRGPDGKPDTKRPAGYTTVKRKTVVTVEDAIRLIRERDAARQKKP